MKAFDLKCANETIQKEWEHGGEGDVPREIARQTLNVLAHISKQLQGIYAAMPNEPIETVEGRRRN